MINFPGAKSKHAGLIFTSIYFLTVTLVLFILSRHWSYDDPYITYRYVTNILGGNGFVYNPGEHVLSTTTPLFALLLSGLRWILPDLPQLAILIGAASLAAGGLILFQLAREYQTPIIGWVCLLMYPIFPLALLTLGSETPLYLALILGVIFTYHQKKYSLAGFLSALTVLTRPDGLLVPALLAIHFLLFNRAQRPFPWRAILVFVGLNLAWFTFAWIYFGAPLPVTLAAKQQQGLMAISERFLPGLITTVSGYAASGGYWVAAGLMVLGAGFVLKERRWMLLLCWTAAYLAAYTALGVTRYFWYYVPLVPAVVVLVGGGFNLLWNLRPRLAQGWARLALPGIGLILIAGVGLTLVVDGWRFGNLRDERILAYTQVGTWLNEHAAADASVGTLEVGAIGYYAQRRMIDFSGLLQPDVARQLTPETTYEDAALYAVARYRPDYIILTSGVFPKLRQGPIAQDCRSLESFQNGKIALDLFACQWN